MDEGPKEKVNMLKVEFVPVKPLDEAQKALEGLENKVKDLVKETANLDAYMKGALDAMKGQPGGGLTPTFEGLIKTLSFTGKARLASMQDDAECLRYTVLIGRQLDEKMETIGSQLKTIAESLKFLTAEVADYRPALQAVKKWSEDREKESRELEKYR